MASFRRASVLAAILAIVIIAMPACATQGTSGKTGITGGSTTVVEKDFKFDPTTVAVKVGDKVTFDNQDTVAHHIMVGTSDLGEQQPGKSVSWTADKDGRYDFRCLIHPSMTGQITVGSGGETGGSGTSGGGSSQTPPKSGY